MEANLKGANLSFTYVDGAHFTAAHLDGAVFGPTWGLTQA
jgi:uncharacterized protein YjbI with pentapeptide repeats